MTDDQKNSKGKRDPNVKGPWIKTEGRQGKDCERKRVFRPESGKGVRILI